MFNNLIVRLIGALMQSIVRRYVSLRRPLFQVQAEKTSPMDNWIPETNKRALENKRSSQTANPELLLKILIVAVVVAAVFTIFSVFQPQLRFTLMGTKVVRTGPHYKLRLFGGELLIGERSPGWVYFWLLMAAGFGLFVSEEALNVWNAVTVLTKEQVAEKELKIDAMVKAKQSATPSTSAAPLPTASQQLVPLNYNTSASSSLLPQDPADAFNPSFRWRNLANNLSAPHHRYTCGKMICQLQNPEYYLWQGFMDDASMPYDEQMADELDFNLANAFSKPDSISDSEPEVINEDDEVRRLNPIKMETDDVKVEEPSTSTSTSSTSLKGFSIIGDMIIIDIDGLNQEQVWKVFEFIYNSVYYGVRFKELTQREAVIMITAGFQGMLRYWWNDLNQASKTFIRQGGIPDNFENVITLFFAAVVIQFLGSQQKIKDMYKDAFFRVQQIKLTCSILSPLRIPTDKPLTVYIDASEEAWKRILCEIDNDEPIICRWASGRFSDTETRYHSIQKELLAGVNAVLAFRQPPTSTMAMIVSSFKKLLSNNLEIEEQNFSSKWNLPKNGVTVLTKEQVAEKELKYSERYILPPANTKLQLIESTSNCYTIYQCCSSSYCITAVVPLNYNTSASSSILPRMFSALQSSAILTDGFPQSESPFIAKDLADAFNPSFRWGNLANNLSAPHHRYTCGETVCQLQNPENYLWQGFMDDASMPYDEQMADELDFNLANASPELDSISDSEPEVINEDDEVRRPVKMEPMMSKLKNL
ncbi:hypothetical protein L7F22_063206 [Adiantum nelumboides]|nr:hypothetical protein [Adiantum nelumboides]